MFIYDSHCHLEYISNLKKHNIYALIPAITLKETDELNNIRKNHIEYKIGFGLHPWYIESYPDIEIFKKDLIDAINKYQPDFIGEIGLDYLKPNQDKQKEYFICQLLIAKKFNLPVVIHCVHAYNDIITLLKKYKIAKGIIHAFNANSKIAKQLTDIGLILGIGGLIAKNTQINQCINSIALNKIALESDAPFMPAFNKKESRVEDLFLYAQIIANKYNISLIDLINQSNSNINSLFIKRN